MKSYPTEVINDLIKYRRSIYPQQYSGEQVPREVIEQMLENANWAPNHGITQPWRFVVFHGQGLQKLADFQANLYKELSSGAGNFNEATYGKLSTNPLKASYVIAICLKRDPNEKFPVVEEVEALAAAVQNMQLTATAYGVGCYWGSGGITYKEEAKPFFGLEEKDELLGFLYVGMPNVWPEKGFRKDWKEKVEWVE